MKLLDHLRSFMRYHLSLSQGSHCSEKSCILNLDIGAEKVLNLDSFSLKNQVVESLFFKNVTLVYLSKYLVE